MSTFPRRAAASAFAVTAILAAGCGDSRPSDEVLTPGPEGQVEPEGISPQEDPHTQA